MSNKIPMPEAPEGFEWVKAKFPSGIYFLSWEGENYFLKEKQKRYDWSKTADYVWVFTDDTHTDVNNNFQMIDVRRSRGIEPIHIIDCWLHHFGGPCPFDPDAVIVEVEFRDGSRIQVLARDVDWGRMPVSGNEIIAVRFIKLVDGYIWG